MYSAINKFKDGKTLLSSLIVIIAILMSGFIYAKLVNLPKNYTNTVMGKFSLNDQVISVQNKNGLYYLNYTDSALNNIKIIKLPWKPTHLDHNAKTGVVVLGSLQNNGHKNSKSKISVFKEGSKLFELDSVDSFAITGSGESIFVLRNKVKVSTSLYDLSGVELAKKEWGVSSGSEAIKFSISANGKRFLPLPQSEDIETWDSVKLFQGENFEDAVLYSFEGEAIIDGIALDNGVILQVGRSLLSFDNNLINWKFTPLYADININGLLVSDDYRYVLASDASSNSFYVFDHSGNLILEHNETRVVSDARALSYLKSINNGKGQDTIRTYEFKGDYLVVNDDLKITIINLLNQKKSIMPNNKILDVSPSTRKKLYKNSNREKDNSDLMIESY